MIRGVWLIGATVACLCLAPSSVWAQAHEIGTEDLWRGRSEQNELNANRNAGISKGMDWLSLGINIANAAGELNQADEELSNDDAAWRPDFNPPGMPEIPISCAENAECQSCYARAQHELNFLRVQFERLRAIYGGTKKMSDKAIAFGDAVSGIHGMMGLAWMSARKDIQNSVEHLGKTYDKKYTDLLAALERQLKAMAVCEAEHFDTPDWYNRFGFIYYQFMAARYKRPD